MPRQRLTSHVNLTVLVTALVVTAIDALTKAWARNTLSAHSVHVFWVLWLRLQFNPGISFSMNRSGPIVTTVATAVVALVVALVALRARPGPGATGFGLLIGGGIANVIDRLAASPHEVTDFVAVGNFPVFNLADVAITLGFAVLLAATLRGEKLLS